MSTSHGATPSGKHDDPSIAPTAYVVVAFVVVFVIALISLQAYFGRMESDEEQAKILAPTVKPLADLRAAQQARLSTYHWVSADSGWVAVPIDRAMTLVAQDLQRASEQAGK